MILSEFAQVTAIKVSDEEVHTEFQTVLAAKGIDDPQLLSGFNLDSELGDNIRNSLLEGKILEQLRLLAQGLLDLEAETAEESEAVAAPEAVAPEAE